MTGRALTHRVPATLDRGCRLCRDEPRRATAKIRRRPRIRQIACRPVPRSRLRVRAPAQPPRSRRPRGRGRRYRPMVLSPRLIRRGLGTPHRAGQRSRCLRASHNLARLRSARPPPAIHQTTARTAAIAHGHRAARRPPALVRARPGQSTARRRMDSATAAASTVPGQASRSPRPPALSRLGCRVKCPLHGRRIRVCTCHRLPTPDVPREPSRSRHSRRFARVLGTLHRP